MTEVERSKDTPTITFLLKGEMSTEAMCGTPYEEHMSHQAWGNLRIWDMMLAISRKKKPWLEKDKQVMSGSTEE